MQKTESFGNVDSLNEEKKMLSDNDDHSFISKDDEFPFGENLDNIKMLEKFIKENDRVNLPEEDFFELLHNRIMNEVHLDQAIHQKSHKYFLNFLPVTFLKRGTLYCLNKLKKK